MKTIGYLGLGVMGYGMTSNLIDKSGGDVYGYDPVPALRERFAARGGKALDQARGPSETCDIIFMYLPTNAIIQGHHHHGDHGIARPGPFWWTWAPPPT